MKSLISRNICVLFLLTLVNALSIIGTAQNLVTYAGGQKRERFNTVIELSDGTVLIGGGADDLNWIPANVSKVQLAATGINNAQGTNRFGFILHLSRDLTTILRVVHFPQNAVEDIRFIKTTSLPGAPTGHLYISGTTLDSKANNGGFFIARLNNNFVNGVPSAMSWVRNNWATGDHQTTQPWDVGSDGRVIYATVERDGDQWAAVYCLKANGEDEVMENWRYHWGNRPDGTSTEMACPTASACQGITVTRSGIVFKAAGRVDLRSWSQADYDAVIDDGNGSTKKGRWPMDLFFSGPGDPGNPTTVGPGYTGYRLGAKPTQRIGGITIDRRNNHFYIGFSVQSKLPDGLPDFEPAVIAMTSSGALKWWSRLYTETSQNSTPDQYVDGLAIDYSRPADTANVVVLARCHGNNTYNLWSGSSISKTRNPDNPGSSFHNGFTGTSGNIHISWIGKLRASDGTLMYASYLAEYEDGMTNVGAAYPEPIHDGWPSHNTGWPNLNTTGAQTDIRTDSAGRVYVMAVGRRTITTSNAWQKMLRKSEGSSTWNNFVRVFEPDLKTLAYSSLLTGTWDKATGAGGDNTELRGIFPISNGLLTVGYHRADTGTTIARGNPVPVVNVPAWGASAPVDETALLARLTFSSQVNTPPAVSLSAPSDGAMYNAPASITLLTNVTSGSSAISKVEFFNGTTTLGETTAAPFSFAWNNVSSGSYQVTAKVTDASGATAISTAIRVIVAAKSTTVSAASYVTAVVSPEAIVAGFGQNLATSVAAASTTPLPTTMSGTTVTVKDSAGVSRQAPLFFVSPSQVNYLIPKDTSPGTATVMMTDGAGNVSMETLEIASVAPGLFTADASGQGWPAALVLRAQSNGTQLYQPVAQYDTAQGRFVAAPVDLSRTDEEVFLVLFGTGIRYRSATTAVTASAGGTPLEVVYSGAQGSLVGLDQINLRLPRTMAGRGVIDLTLTIDGRQANTVKLQIK